MDIGMRKALVVGIDDYPKQSLDGCINDAHNIAKLLRTNEDGSPNFSVHVVENITTKSELKTLIIKCFCGHEDIALLYFSGHGHIDSLGGYIVTPDFAPNDVGVSMSEILAIANDSKVRNRIIILDCCHAGFMGQKTTSDQISHIGDGVTILTACRSEQTSTEKNGQGVFTELLVAALNGGAADITGNITPGGIYAYIDKALGPWEEQRPIFKTNISKFTSLRNVEPTVDIDILRKLPFFFKDSCSEFQLDPSYEDTNDPNIQHKYFEPYGTEEHIKVFKQLQKLVSVGIVKPIGTDHMYFAALENKSCALTSLGQYYWNLAKQEKI